MAFGKKKYGPNTLDYCANIMVFRKCFRQYKPYFVLILIGKVLTNFCRDVFG
ncbi:hypothetical protein E1J53_0009740 [Lewinella sp. W8]|nr:hypothetical protein [Lewinella sp. W8]